MNSIRLKSCLLVLVAGMAGLVANSAGAAAIRDTALFADHTLMPFDDTNSGNFPSFPLNLLGTQSLSMSVNSNGAVSHANLWPINFNQLAQNNNTVLAPFLANIDNRYGGLIQWGFDEIDGHRVLGAQWLGVLAYSNRPELTNSFQIIITERSDQGAGAFDFEFNYDQIAWDTTDPAWWDADRNPDVARVGWFNALTGVGYEFEGSGVAGALLDGNLETGLIHHSRNSDVLGRYVFEVRNGEVLAEIETPPANPVPEPGSLALVLGGLAAAWESGRRHRLAGLAK